MDAAEARKWVASDALDYQAIGFRCGLEIHQQLATRKLFSLCPSDVVDPEAIQERTTAAVRRRLRATQSELGETDPAVLAEVRRKRAFRYLAIDGLTSLVELDEEPPVPMSEDALDVALTFAGLLGARPAREVHVMRKTVIDGSNTSGFQRTALVATGGTIDADDGVVGVWTIALEEDSARKVDDEHEMVTYSLDRLGVPLIEVATAPDIRDPQHAKATAARIGALLRATGRVRRGLGSIRQDLNVSVGVGDRVEIKGCQDLRAVPDVIERECRRQLWLHVVSEELKQRGFDASEMGSPHDVTDAMAGSGSKVVTTGLDKGHTVLALRLPRLAGLIAGPAADGPRLGRELADHAKVRAGVKGIFHSDELPAYGIEQAEVDGVRTATGCEDQDAFVLCVAPRATAEAALEAVAERAAAALAGVAREVRAANPDGSTKYMRPLPGAARMYPETDVPPTRIDDARWVETLGNLPLRPEEQVASLVDAGAGPEVAAQLVASGRAEAYHALLEGGADAGLAGRVLTQFLVDMQHEDAVLDRLPEVFAALLAGDFAKEALPAVIAALDAAPGASMEAVLGAAGAGRADDDEVDAILAALVAERIDFVRERGAASVGPLMGPAMQQLRGKVDGGELSARLRAAIEAALS